jgi:hypothetical protein
MGFDFSLVDVLSDRPFGGNQLAAFPMPPGSPTRPCSRGSQCTSCQSRTRRPMPLPQETR